MSTTLSFCPNCRAPVQPETIFCANCGTELPRSPVPSPPQPQPTHYPSTATRPAVSTAAYKAVIAALLVIILLLGIGYYEASAGNFPFSLGSNRYQLAHPPNYQSTQPAPASTLQVYTDPIWNACNGPPSQGCTMSSNGWREGSVPDTFDYYVSFTSSVNVTIYFFTMGQFVQFSVCNGDIRCVSGYYDSIPATTNLPKYTLFKLGEGCADYLAIYVASGSGTMYPDVGVTHNPSQSSATGYCVQQGA